MYLAGYTQLYQLLPARRGVAHHTKTHTTRTKTTTRPAHRSTRK
jgi:hypothetical protein